MADLNTKTLNELDVVTDINDTDYVLIEQSGRMKRVNGSKVGGGVCILDLREYEDQGSGGEVPQ